MPAQTALLCTRQNERKKETMNSLEKLKDCLERDLQLVTQAMALVERYGIQIDSGPPQIRLVEPILEPAAPLRAKSTAPLTPATPAKTAKPPGEAEFISLAKELYPGLEEPEAKEAGQEIASFYQQNGRLPVAAQELDAWAGAKH
jgi:hypothetical protein